MRILLFGLGLLFVCASSSAQDTGAAEPAMDKQTQQPDLSPLRELGDDYHNSIKLLQNRFRIDYQVGEITMVFFREFGSAPVVLVQPDGSKIFQGDADGENIFWYDATTYDLISIKNPTPGPWQAVGQILPQSRVMVLSEVQLHADPLPDIIFSGEILKQTARLTNGGEPIKDPEFRDVVSLDIRLISTNNPNYNNFGAEIQTIATFEDDGRGMDEQPLDGVFTGQFNLAVADGEWTPVFVVNTPLFTREQVDNPLMLFPNPIKISHLLDGGGDGYHKLVIDAEREHVDMNTLLIDGKVRFPNGDVHNFSLTEQSPDAREHLVVNYDYGVYRVKLTVYGNTKSGRDFILDVPEYTFLVETPIEEVPPEPDAEQELAGQAPSEDVADSVSEPVANPEMAVEVEVPEEQQGMATSTLISLIVGINVGILLVGGAVIWFINRKPKTKDTLPELKPARETKEDVAQEQGDPAPEQKQGIFAKVKSKLAGLFSKKKTTQTGDIDAQDDAGIIDLSIPEEQQ